MAGNRYKSPPILTFPRASAAHVLPVAGTADGMRPAAARAG